MTSEQLYIFERYFKSIRYWCNTLNMKGFSSFPETYSNNTDAYCWNTYDDPTCFIVYIHKYDLDFCIDISWRRMSIVVRKGNDDIFRALEDKDGTIEECLSKFIDFMKKYIDMSRFPSYSKIAKMVYDRYIQDICSFFKTISDEHYLDIEIVTHNKVEDFFNDKSIKSFTNRDELVCIYEHRIVMSFGKTPNLEYNYSISNHNSECSINSNNFLEFKRTLQTTLYSISRNEEWASILTKANLKFLTGPIYELSL